MNEEPQWRNSSSYSNNHRWNQRYQYSDYDESTDSENSESDLSSQRLTLGLNASGPLNLEDVKNAWVFNELPVRKDLLSDVLWYPYWQKWRLCHWLHMLYICRYRVCALKWHPDRHQGSSKVHLFHYCYIFVLMFYPFPPSSPHTTLGFSVRHIQRRLLHASITINMFIVLFHLKMIGLAPSTGSYICPWTILTFACTIKFMK